MADGGAVDLGFVGVGAMGGPMVRRLLESGRTPAIYDVRAEAVEALVERGAVACDSPAAVASVADTVLVSLPTPDVVVEVATGPDGLLHGSAIRRYVDLSTVGTQVAEQVAQALEEAGIRCLDSPVSGGVAGATAGTLAIMASGSEELLEEVRPLLEVLGANIFHVGPRPGQAQVAKLVNNLLSATAIAITSEALVLAVKAGLSPRVVLDVLNAGSGRNTATSDKFPRCVLPRTFDVGFRLGLMTKDVQLCLTEARRQQVPMFLAGAVDQLWTLGAAVNGGGDSTELVKLVEEWAGVVVEEPPAPT